MSVPMAGLPGNEEPNAAEWAMNRPEGQIPVVCARCGVSFEEHAGKDHEFKTIDMQTIDVAKANLRSAARGDPDEWRHPDLYEHYVTEAHTVDDIDLQLNAEAFMRAMHMEPTPDAVGQLLEVFVPCLRIMCDRGYEPTGGLWRKAGILGIIWDVRKKFERLWYRTWTLGIRHDDSGFDLINFTGMLLRADPDSRFGDAGEPAGARDA
jgi:hypothetical protein